MSHAAPGGVGSAWSSLWRWLTDPNPIFQQAEERMVARLTAVITLVAAGIALISGLLQFWVIRSIPTLVIVLSAVALLSVAYAFSRSRRYQVGILIGLLTMNIGSFAAIIVERDLVLAGITIVAIMLGAMLLPGRWLIAMVAFNWLGIAFLVPMFFTQVRGTDMIVLVSVFLLTSILAVVAAYFRQWNLAQIEQRNRELGESENRFRSMADTAPVMIWMTDADWMCVYCNQSWLSFSGRTLEQESGTGWQEDIHPNDLKRCMITYHRASENQQPFELEYRALRHDGVYRWILEHGTPRFLPDGSFAGYIGSCVDITERKQSEDGLRESETKFRAIFDKSLDVIVIIEVTSGRILQANHTVEMTLGYEPEALTGQHFSMLLPPNPDESGKRLRDWLAKEQVFRRADGSYAPMDVNATLIPWGMSEAILFNLRDNSERKLLAQQEVELAKEKARVEALRNFISATSHDLRTPLSIINTSAYLLRKKVDNASAEPYLDRLDAQTSRLNRVIDDFINMSSLDYDDVEFQFQAVDLNGLTQPIIAQYKLMAARKDQKLEFEHDDAPVLANADGIQLIRAIQGILANAINYTPDGGTVQVRVARTGAFAMIEVRDNGIGIPNDSLTQIFEPFYRQDRARSIDTGGSGLGLAIARKIITKHNGTIEVESEAGVGSVFRIFLPAAESTAVRL